MSTPILHVLAGPNGAGKSTFVHKVLQPTTRLPFVNADEIAAERWPGSESEHAYEASRAAAEQRAQLVEARSSFIAETVFSHPSKVDLVRQCSAAGYVVALHVVMVPLELTLLRVKYRVGQGGHTVPSQKIRERYERLWPLVATACTVANRSVFYDNCRSDSPFRTVATFHRGRSLGGARWPSWTPSALTDAEWPS